VSATSNLQGKGPPFISWLLLLTHYIHSYPAHHSQAEEML